MTPPLRVAFAGTPAFAATALQAIAAAGFAVPLVLTQPDRPAGRGLKLQPSPVKALAQRLGLALAQPRGLRLDGRFADDAAAARAALLQAAPEVMVVAAYGLILPPWVLELPTHGCLNIHASLLPRWRGAAPIQRAIEAGDTETGITLMQMDAGLDTGPMLLRQALPVGPEDTSATLHERLAALGAELAVRGLRELQAGHGLPAERQPEVGACYATKIDKAEAAIDFTRPAAEIERRIRAFDPAPGCHLEHAGTALKVWSARVLALPDPGAGTAPGAALDLGPDRLAYACGRDALELLQVQPAGGTRMSAAEFLRRRH